MIDPGEETVVCPYDRAHVLLKSRMQTHLPKCRNQNPNMEKATCPFNSTHIVNYVELAYHKEHCQDRIVVDCFIYNVGDTAPPAGLQPVRSFNVPVTDEDDWDSDKPVVSVLDQVKEAVQHKGVLINKIGAPKAERKAHRFNERLRYQSVTSGNQQFNDDHAQSSQRNVPGPSKNSTPPFTTQSTQQEQFETAEPGEIRPPKQFSSDEAADYPVAGQKGGNTLYDKMSGLVISESDVPELDHVDDEAAQNPPPSVWGRPISRNLNEKITWPTAAPRAAPPRPRFSSNVSQGNSFQAPRPSMPSRTPSNPWATKINQQVSEPTHLPSAPPRMPAPRSADVNPAINGIWARGLALNNSQARMTSEDFPSLLPISSRGRKQPRP